MVVVSEIAEQVQPSGGVRPSRDCLLLDAGSGACLIVQQAQRHQDDGNPLQPPNQIVGRLLGPQPELSIRTAGAVYEQRRRVLHVACRYPARLRPLREHFDGAGDDGGQPDRDARLQHVDEDMPRRGIGVRTHEAADVVREAAARLFGDGTLVGNPMRVRALSWSPESGRCRLEREGQSNGQELVETHHLVGFVEPVGGEVRLYVAAMRKPLAESTQEHVVFVAVRDREMAHPVRRFAPSHVIVLGPIGEHGDDHFGNVAEIRNVPREIDPARHVVGRRDALHLLVPAESVPDVLETEAEQEVAENGPLNRVVEPAELLALRELRRDSVHGGLSALLGRRPVRRAVRGQEPPGSPPMAEAEHVEDGRKKRGDLELLKRNRQHFVIVAGPDFLHQVR